MKITCISDLHGSLPTTTGGDILLLAGDYTTNDSISQWKLFYDWLNIQDYKKKIYIAGNHDNFLSQAATYHDIYPDFEGLGIYDDNTPIYLCNDYYIYNNIKIYGLPYTKSFPQMNKQCMSFTFPSERDLANIYASIPKDIDILLTHNPPYGIYDSFKEWGDDNKILYTGSPSLRYQIENIQPKLVVCGHIHEHGGSKLLLKGNMGSKNTWIVNASHMNAQYEPVNQPVDIII